MVSKRTCDTLPRLPRRRSSHSLDFEDCCLEELLDSLPEETRGCESTTVFSSIQNDDFGSLADSGFNEFNSSSVGRWSSSSSIDYYHTDDESDIQSRIKKVRFNAVQIREYAVREGDHPNCEVPLTLDWKHTKTELQHIEAYESLRMLHKKHGSLCPRRLSVEEREERILSSSANV